MSDTPRTDEVVATLASPEVAWVRLALHSRNLERENADLRRQLAEARDRALEDGYLAGFMESGEGWNGDYPYASTGVNHPLNDKGWVSIRDNTLSKLKGQSA